ncbi:MAG: hypothetical protein K8T91_11060 [Planctomycetes bacterium]|nr:hypothetical protein [Planctomycetota bacterium]
MSAPRAKRPSKVPHEHIISTPSDEVTVLEDRTFVREVIWHCEVRDVPMQIRWRKEDEDRIIEGIAQLLWKCRHIPLHDDDEGA